MTLHSLRAVCWIVIYAISYYKRALHKEAAGNATYAAGYFTDEFLS